MGIRTERSGSDGRALDWVSKGYWFEPHCRRSYCVVSLSKTLYSLLSTCSTLEDLPDMTEILLTGMLTIKSLIYVYEELQTSLKINGQY